MIQDAGAGEVAKEAGPQPRAFRGADNQPWHIGHHEAAFRTDAHGAEVGHEGGEGVIGDLGARCRDRANERRFTGVRKAQEAHIGDELELKS